MSTRIVTLFGEEIVPGPQKPAAKTRSKKGKEAAGEETTEESEQNEEVTAEPDATAVQNEEQPETIAEVAAQPAVVVAQSEESIAAETTEQPQAAIIQDEESRVVTEVTELPAAIETEAAEPETNTIPEPPAQATTAPVADTHISKLSLDELGISYEYMTEALLQREYGRVQDDMLPATYTAPEQTTESPVPAATQEEIKPEASTAPEPIAETADNPPLQEEAQTGGAIIPEPIAEIAIPGGVPTESAEAAQEGGTDELIGNYTTAPEEPAEIIPEDWKGDKNYYGIGEVAAFFSVKTSHIRFWTNEFKLKVRTTRKGDRLYTPDQVRELRAIYHLVKERGFTLSGAKTRLKEQNKRDVAALPLKDQLLALRTKLQILRDQL